MVVMVYQVTVEGWLAVGWYVAGMEYLGPCETEAEAQQMLTGAARASRGDDVRECRERCFNGQEPQDAVFAGEQFDGRAGVIALQVVGEIFRPIPPAEGSGNPTIQADVVGEFGIL